MIDDTIIIIALILSSVVMGLSVCTYHILCDDTRPSKKVKDILRLWGYLPVAIISFVSFFYLFFKFFGDVWIIW